MAYFIMMRMQERSDDGVPLTSQINSWKPESLISERTCMLSVLDIGHRAMRPLLLALPQPCCGRRLVKLQRCHTHQADEDVKGDARYTSHSSSRSGSRRGMRLQWLMLFCCFLCRMKTELVICSVILVLSDGVVSRQGG